VEKILIAASSSAGMEHLEEMVRAARYEVSIAGTAAEAGAALMKDEPGVMILSADLPDMPEILNKGKEAVPDLRIILITEDNEVPGDCNYIRMDSQPSEIQQIIRLNFELRQLKQQNYALKQQSEQPLSLNLIAESEPMRLILEQTAEIARHEHAAVMISGESGTGKKTLAQSIHLLSSRKEYPFLEINCAAFPNILLERKLFGYEKEASAGKKGVFEIAAHGTVFLNEIRELPLNLQEKLLCILEKGYFSRTGGQRKIDADVRIIAAETCRVTETFRVTPLACPYFLEALYLRLNSFAIHIPALRGRPADISALARLFLFQFSRQFNKKFREIEAQAAERLKQYAWPGNVRELRNVIERGCILYDDKVFRMSHLPEEILSRKNDISEVIQASVSDIDIAVDEVACQIIRQAMRKSGGNISWAARELGIPRGTLRYKLKKYKTAL
jgi:two-component system, NtrC family, response regulator AtoC